MKINKQTIFTAAFVLLTTVIGTSLFQSYTAVMGVAAAINEEVTEYAALKESVTQLSDDGSPKGIGESVDELPDYRGWLTIPGTNIDYPVLQGPDNEYYLTRSYTGAYDSKGSLFLDYRAAPDDQNLVIHGHNLGQTPAMFTELLNFLSPDYLAAHPSFTYQSVGSNSAEYRVFAVMEFDVTHLDEFDYMAREFSSEAEFLGWLSYIDTHSAYRAGALPAASDKIVTLSTCSLPGETEQRVVVFGVSG